MGRKNDNHQGGDVFLTLDGLRGYGAILIVIGHTILFWGYFVVPTSPVCVDLFFLLSGFVIAYAYEPRFAAGMGVREFMTHRIVRLYPLYLLGLGFGLMLALAGVHNEADPAGYLAGVAVDASLQSLMLPSPDSQNGLVLYSFNIPAWTLIFELMANVVYVVIWRLLTTRVLAALVVVLGVILGVAVAVHGAFDLGPGWNGFAVGLLRGLFGFFAGVLGYRLVGSPRRAPKLRSLWPLYIFAVVTVISILPASPQIRPYLDLLFVLGLGMPLLVAAQMAEPPRFLAPLMAMLGRISYAVYILHYPLYEIMLRLTWRSPTLTAYEAYIGPFLLMFVLIVAYAAERWYDRPVRRWIVAQLRARAARAGTQTGTQAGTQRASALRGGRPAPGSVAYPIAPPIHRRSAAQRR